MFDAIIVMAGSGQRANLKYNKAFYEIFGKPVFMYSVEKFRSIRQCANIILVVNEKEIEDVKKYIKDEIIVIGGKTRLESVYNGTQKVLSDFVLVHDAARPNVKIEDIIKVYETLKDYDASALGVKPSNTIKEISGSLFKKTLNRDELVEVQTPQGFKSKIYINAIKKAINDDAIIYDDIQILEKYENISAKLVLGSYSNIKITNPIDFHIIELLMREGL